MPIAPTYPGVGRVARGLIETVELAARQLLEAM